MPVHSKTVGVAKIIKSPNRALITAFTRHTRFQLGLVCRGIVRSWVVMVGLLVNLRIHPYHAVSASAMSSPRTAIYCQICPLPLPPLHPYPSSQAVPTPYPSPLAVRC